MLKFKSETALLSTLMALMLLFASGTFSEAQTSLTPPPIPVEEEEQDAVTPPPPPEEETEVAPPPPPPAEQFFVSTDGSTEGPFTLSELAARLAAGTFNDQTYVWQEGMADWQRAGEVDKLDTLLAGAPGESTTATAVDITRFLTGIWVDKNATFVPGLGQVQMDMQTEYYSNGTMDGIGQFTSVNNGVTSVYDVYVEGTWSAQATTGNGFNLTTQAQVAIGLVESPVYTDFFDVNETVRHERIGPDSFRDLENNLTYTRQ